MKIATWNVNSIRIRRAQVVEWLQTSEVDVLCLQETKVVDESFPQQEFLDIGYQVVVFGQKSYNGVAMLSRTSLSDVKRGFATVLGDRVAAFDEQKRVIAGTIGSVRIVNLYVPNGSAVGSDKYDYKLRWLEVLHEYLKTLLAESEQLLVCGDFNVALEDIDIYNPKGREKLVMATDLERQALRQAVLALGLSDSFRKFNSEPGQFSWWDYRTRGFSRNAGWRIDHIYLSPRLYQQAIDCTIDVNPRKLDQPSDHTPVIVELQVEL
jgi:exodeoxyribonuclease-3